MEDAIEKRKKGIERMAEEMCRCGHSRIVHTNTPFAEFHGYCVITRGGRGRQEPISCPCEKFTFSSPALKGGVSEGAD